MYALIQAIEQAIDNAVTRKTHELANGVWADHAAGRRLVGHIAGLKQARTLVMETYANFEKLEDSDE